MDFLQAKEDRLALEDAAVQTAKAKYKLELEWMRRQPQARQTKSKSRIDAFYKLQKSTKPRPQDIMLSLESADRRIGGKILSMKNVNLKFGDTVILNNFSYEFCMGDRICIAGGNGVGKVRLDYFVCATSCVCSISHDFSPPQTEDIICSSSNWGTESG
jgi:ABC transport system ATP-binding/permease protein